MNITERGFTLSTETDKGKNMANQISTEAADAFIAGVNYNKSNTRVVVEEYVATGKITRLTYHGNTIAQRANGVTKVTNCGFFTRTTKERLNAIPGVQVNQKAGVWYLNGNEWDGGWTVV